MFRLTTDGAEGYDYAARLPSPVEMARAYDYWTAAARAASTAIEKLAALNETLCRIADADIPEEN